MSTTTTDTFARLYRAVEFAADEEVRKRRRAGIDALVKGISLRDVEPLVRLAFKTKQGASAEAVARYRQVFQSQDEAFPASGNEREIQVLSAAVLAGLLARTGPIAAGVAMAVTTTSLAGARKPDLAVDLAAAAEQAIASQGELHRRRPQGSPAAPQFPQAEFDKASAKVNEQPDPSGVQAGVTLLIDATKALHELLTKHATEALRAAHRTIAMQDEELQMLWWLLGERSWLLDQSFAKVGKEERPFVFATELASVTRFPPGPRALKPLLQRAGVKEQDKATITSCVNSCSSEWLRTIADSTDPSPVTTPLHFAIKRKVETGDDTSWIAGWSAATDLDAERKLSLLTLAQLFYRERLQVLAVSGQSA